MKLRTIPRGAWPLALDATLDLFRPPALQARALHDIAALPRGRVIVAERAERTVGYLTFHPPSEVERWHGDRSGCLMELGAIEVAPAERGQHVGARLLDEGFRGGVYDGTIVYATLYRWQYDLARTGLGPIAYRRLLLRFYAHAGLHEVATNDPEILEDRANALLARVGAHAPLAVRAEFARLCNARNQES